MPNRERPFVVMERPSASSNSLMAPTIPRTRSAPLITQLVGPFTRFAAAESAGGIVLIVCAVIALVWANSPWASNYDAVWHVPITVGTPRLGVAMSLQHWINDGLMAIFFFVVGLEIKREMLAGELASARNAALPITAALGGMVVPAILYTVLNRGHPGHAGWGIPMATDIAFALGVLTLLGPRVPVGLKVFLAALAIADDLGAVLVIAIFYTNRLAWTWLAIALAAIAVSALGNVAGARRPAFYTIAGLVAWFAMLQSGVHATIAGVLLAFTIPAWSRIDDSTFAARGRALLDEFDALERPDAAVPTNPEQQEVVHDLERACEQVQGPLNRAEHALHAPVAFVIVPLFALANAGVSLVGTRFAGGGSLVTAGVMLGLVLGKPIGITLFSWTAVRLGIAALPHGATWRALHGVSWLGGIGFTMSLFVAGLAFGAGPLLGSAKVGILSASVLAGLVGWLVLRATPAPAEAQ